MHFSRSFATLLTLSLLSAAAIAQAPTKQPPPPVSEQQQPGAKNNAGAQPEKKITPQEADELFKSVDEILRFSSKQTGLPIKHPVKHKLTSRDEVQAFIEKRMKDDPDAKRMEDSEFVMKKFGLLPATFNLRTFMVSMLREQVAGYYDTKTKTMNLLDWLPPEVQKPVMAHELTHALQDQAIELEKWAEAGHKEGEKLSMPDELKMDEVRVARQSVTEGQAMLALIDYSLAPMGRSTADAPDAVTMMTGQMMEGGDSPVFASAPLYIKRALMFAYREGTEFEEQVLLKKGQQTAFMGTLQSPPQDTHEVMEPNEYLAGNHVPVLAVPDYDKVLGKDWEQVDFGALGQFDVNVLIELYADADTSAQLTPAWRGGYYYAAQRKGSPSGNVAFVYVSKWKDAESAQQYARVLAESWKRRYQSLRAIKAASTGNVVKKETDQGTVSVEHDGNLVISIESFPEGEASALRKTALAADSGEAQNARLLPMPNKPLLDLPHFIGMPALLLSSLKAVRH